MSGTDARNQLLVEPGVSPYSTYAVAPTPNALMPSVDPLDFSNRYNTQLSPAEEQQFQAWAAANNRLRDTYDYDLRGAFKSGAATAPNGHLPDTYKKPNHPTFSDQSQYHGVDGYQGGTWGGGDGRPDTFTPGATNMLPPGALQRYFQQREPTAQLLPRPMGGADAAPIPGQGPALPPGYQRDLPQVAPTSWIESLSQRRPAMGSVVQPLEDAPGMAPTWNGGAPQDAPFAINPPDRWILPPRDRQI